ncbi:MAG: Uncharacterized protein FD138_1680 [Planctomycetota bacterium]|nr:MAG: Uncharacterized protein FD138_1680 [Planctomycetota bacterium]
MTDKHITVDSIRWHSVLPWLHLLRVPQLAFRVRTIAVATLAVLVFGVGNSGLRELPIRGEKDSEAFFPTLTELSQAISMSFQRTELMDGRWLRSHDAMPRRREEDTSFLQRRHDVHGWYSWPLETVYQPSKRLFEFKNSWSDVATAWTALLWSVMVWAVFGGALCRMMAVRFGRDESVSLRAALRFSLRNWQSYIYCPMLPMLGVGLFALLAAGVGGLERWLDVSNGMVLALFGFVPILCAIAMTCLLALTSLSWPLMTAAISTEGSDGFDGLSRAFGYVMNRFWFLVFTVWLTAFGISYVALTVVEFFFDAVVWLADWSVGPTSQSDGGAVWLHMLNILCLGVVVSLFWSATTVIYFLLRQSDDGTPLDEVYISGPPPKAEPLPLVGVAASQQPVIERPATEPAGDSPTTPANS